MNASPTVANATVADLDSTVEHAMGRHPLEMFPVFRRWECGFWRDIVYTAIWNMMIALVFSAFWLVFDSNVPVVKVLTINLIFAQCIGYSIHVLFRLTDRLIPISLRSAFAVRATYYAIVPTVGVYAGYWIASVFLGWRDLQVTLLTARGALSIVLISTLITVVLLAILIPRERAARAQMRIAQEEARVAAAEKETAIARMQLLSAQVEPHFLYNTLAHVVSLVDAEPTTAKRMLDRLIALLRSTASAANGSAGAATLASQLDHLRAYLDILVLRMGSRLTWTIDVPPELAALPVPPMLLQPVVENAIKHGLEPKVDGGDVTVTARHDGDRLVLTVSDTGLGFRALRPADSTGLGLANLRARLGALYGAAADLTIVDNAPSGARVTLALPYPELHAKMTR